MVQRPKALAGSKSSADLGSRPSFGLGGVLGFMDKSSPSKSLLFECI